MEKLPSIGKYLFHIGRNFPSVKFHSKYFGLLWVKSSASNATLLLTSTALSTWWRWIAYRRYQPLSIEPQELANHSMIRWHCYVGKCSARWNYPNIYWGWQSVLPGCARLGRVWKACWLPAPRSFLPSPHRHFPLLRVIAIVNAIVIAFLKIDKKSNENEVNMEWILHDYQRNLWKVQFSIPLFVAKSEAQIKLTWVNCRQAW